MNLRLIIFLKAARVGKVKTRLAESLGQDEACRAYRTLVETLLANLAGIPNVELHYTPKDAAAEIGEWILPNWSACPQCDGDLGRRLSNAFEAAFGSDAKRVVVVGSDCPYVLESDVRAAWDALGSSDVVLGPAIDGGYWLIGLSRSQPELFRGMPWSTNRLLRATVEKAVRCEMKVHLLRKLEDVDTISEWRAFQAAAGIE